MLSQNLTPLEIKQGELTLAISAANVVLGLGFPAGVTEVLFLHLYSAMRVGVELTMTGATPGPVKFTTKGHTILTLAPGGGVTQVRLSNPAADAQINVEYVLGMQPDAATVPTFLK